MIRILPILALAKMAALGYSVPWLAWPWVGQRTVQLARGEPAIMRSSLILAATLGLGLFLMLRTVATALAALPEVSQLPSQPGLPDPLVMLDGQRVTTPELWFHKRRPELKALFQYYMYGTLPPAPVKVVGVIKRQDNRFLEGKATLKEVAITFGLSTHPIQLLLVVPNGRKKPAPVFLGMNFCGNHTLVKDPDVPLPTSWVPASCQGVKDNRATTDSRGSQSDVWDIEEVIDRGYALASFYSGDIDPDRADVREGIQPYYWEKGQTRAGPHDWGTIAAWAWGLQRAVDYLVTDPDIDRDRIAVVGHSRLGKAALVAAAFDERIALVIPHQAGCGGTAPSRGKVGESVKVINDHFPHWFDATFKEFNDRPDRLPFDQNCLVALVAPRAVLLTNGTEDTWANPQGQFQVLQAADPVYRLLKAGGLDAREMPPPGKLIASQLGYHIRPGKHSMGKEDWKVFLDYADQHLAK